MANEKNTNDTIAYKLYKEAFDEIEISKVELTKLFNANTTITRSMRNNVGDKINGTRSISKADHAFMQLLRVLNDMNVNLGSFEYDDDGKILSYKENVSDISKTL